ncbi:MAG: hypothetical protein JNM51_02330, partial [Bacteroidia bacterium]|nr:hypothetical protein [Bacteroidia bacterium]
KKQEFKNALDFPNTARDYKFKELYNKSKNEDDIIKKTDEILACTDFYHYISEFHERSTINNNTTIQSIIFDPANYSVYFAANTSYAGWSKRIQFNTQTGKVSLYREENKRLRAKETIDFINLLKTEKKIEDAEEVKLYKDSLKSKGIENYRSLTFLFNSFYNIEEYKLARLEALRLIEKYPDIVTGYYYAGLTYEMEQNYSEAVSWYLKGEKTNINNEYRHLLGKMHLAFSYKETGDLRQAKIYANEALQIYKQYYIPENSDDFNRLEKILSGSK